MIGSWRWNAVSGAGGALVTLLISLGNNPFLTSIIRSVYAFAAFFLIAFAIRWLIPNVLLPKPSPDPESMLEEEPGAVLDLVTPSEKETLSELMKENWAEGKVKAKGQDTMEAAFQPLQPKKLVTLDHPDPEEVVQAIRRLTDER